jgi:hypothetical protein
MGAVNLIIIVESVRALISQEDNNEFHISSIAAVAAALGELSYGARPPRLTQSGLKA